MVPFFFFTSLVYQDMQQYTVIRFQEKLNWLENRHTDCFHMTGRMPHSVQTFTNTLWHWEVCWQLFYDSSVCSAVLPRSLERHVTASATPPLFPVESYSKHGQACESSVCALHMWGSVKSNNAECWHSWRGNDRDNAFKEQLKHASTSVSCVIRGLPFKKCRHHCFTCFFFLLLNTSTAFWYGQSLRGGHYKSSLLWLTDLNKGIVAFMSGRLTIMPTTITFKAEKWIKDRRRHSVLVLMSWIHFTMSSRRCVRSHRSPQPSLA